MMNKFVAATVAVITAGAFASAAMADGPKLSSENSIPAVQVGVPVSPYDPMTQGPKVSSENRIAPTHFATVAAAQPATTALRYVWQEGYDPHGKWRGHWVVAR